MPKINTKQTGRLDEYSQFREHLRRVRKRDKKTNLTLDYLKKVWELQKGKCNYTGIPLVNPGFKNENSTPRWEIASLDRIDPNVGYVEGNIQYVSMLINFAKWNLTDAEMKTFIDIIRDKGTK